MEKTKIIQLQDDIFIEVVRSDNEIEEISGGTSTKIEKDFETIKPALVKIIKPFYDFREELDVDNKIDTYEVTFGLGFQAEGNFYIAKAQTSANLLIKLTFKSHNEIK